MALIIQVCGDEVVVFDDSTPEDDSYVTVLSWTGLANLTQFTLEDLLKAVKIYEETL